MEKTFICNISDEEKRKLLNIFEMKNTLESLAMQIAGNNDILKEDSMLYTRLIEYYKNTMSEYNNFWVPYMKKYNNLTDKGMELTIDFETNSLFAISKQEPAEA